MAVGFLPDFAGHAIFGFADGSVVVEGTAVLELDFVVDLASENVVEVVRRKLQVVSCGDNL